MGDSALAYLYARQLRQKLGVPVGVINASAGGTSIEAWTSETAQRKCPELQPLLAEWETTLAMYEKTFSDYKAALNAWAAQPNASAEKKPAPPKLNVAPKYPGYYFNGMIAPLIPYAIRGVIWYQGEANASSVKTAQWYRHQLPLLIADWRNRWHDDFPFAWVQLPNYEGGPGWMVVREAMLKTLSVPRTGMAVAIDIGESKNIHPKNKQEVARRLSLWALSEVYGQEVGTANGPILTGYQIHEGAVELAFKEKTGALVAKGGELIGFTIAGADQKWQPAKARIEGAKVIVSNPAVHQPVAVRYAWEPDPKCNLYNAADLPASPFRTDEWPVSDGVK